MIHFMSVTKHGAPEPTIRFCYGYWEYSQNLCGSGPNHIFKLQTGKYPMAGKYKFVTGNAIKMTVNNICRKRSSVLRYRKIWRRFVIFHFLLIYYQSQAKWNQYFHLDEQFLNQLTNCSLENFNNISIRYWQHNFSKPDCQHWKQLRKNGKATDLF